MGSVGRDRKPFIFVCRGDYPIAHIPLGNLKPGDPERLQTGPHVIGHNAKVFADHTCGASLFKNRAQVFFAVALVRFAIFRCFVITRNEVRGTAASLFQHLMLIERKKLFVLSRPPREGIDTIKPEDMVDSEQMKDASGSVNALSPPSKTVRAHSIPPIKRNTPVLSPFLRERVVLEMRLGRSTAEPVEYEFIRSRENICAVITDAKWNIAH